MKTKTNGTNTYQIVCDLGKTTVVREFAKRYSAKNTVAEVRVYGRMFSKHPRVIVSFKSNETETNIHKAFMDEFENYDIL